MEKKKPLEYFVTTLAEENKCMIVVPADLATKCADYIEENWKPNLFVDEIIYKPCFYALGWGSHGEVGILMAHQEREDTDDLFLGALATTIAASFFAYCVNFDYNGR